MRLRLVLMGLALLALGFGGIRPAAAKPAGETAFLTEYAESPDQVVTQVERNRLIALRYARVFLKDPSAVLSYFRNELSVVTLDQPMQVEIYRLDEMRRIVRDTREFKVGTKVFANKAGYPVLEYGSGNPLTAELPGRTEGRPKSNPLAKVAGSHPEEIGKPAGGPASSSNPQSALDQALGQTNPATEAPSSALVVASAPGETVIPPSAGTSGGLGTGGGGGASGISSASKWLPAMGAIAAAAALAGGRGGGAGVTTPQGGGGDNPPIVPEPASMMVLGTGLITLGGIIRRMRRN